MRPANTPGEELVDLWYELGRLYSGAAYSASRAVRLGFAVALMTGALVLLSTPVLGTEWAGPFAPTVPVAAGLLAGAGLFSWERTRILERARGLERALAARGSEATRPAREGLGAYYDPQLILLRSEYEFLRLEGALDTARIFEKSFGFTPEDSFETGPLNVAPDTKKMRLLRQKWERRIAMRTERGMEQPELRLGEDLVYSVFPREMTVPTELAMREAYLEISRVLLIRRYGRDPHKKIFLVPEDLRRRTERDLREHAALTGKVNRRLPW